MSFMNTWDRVCWVKLFVLWVVLIGIRGEGILIIYGFSIAAYDVILNPLEHLNSSFKLHIDMPPWIFDMAFGMLEENAKFGIWDRMLFPLLFYFILFYDGGLIIG